MRLPTDPSPDLVLPDAGTAVTDGTAAPEGDRTAEAPPGARLLVCDDEGPLPSLVAQLLDRPFDGADLLDALDGLLRPDVTSP